MIKNIIKNPKKINGEYILLFAVLAGLGFLFYSPNVISQQPPQEIIINSFQPAPYGEFNELKAEVYRDYHNPTNRFVDPMGESQVQTLNIATRLIVEYIGGPPDVDPLYEVDYTNGQIKIKDDYGTTYYGIFEIDESGNRAILRIEYQEGSYPEAFSDDALTYIERSDMGRRADAVSLGVLKE